MGLWAIAIPETAVGGTIAAPDGLILLGGFHVAACVDFKKPGAEIASCRIIWFRNE